jgi:hypothetical protein
VLQKRFVVGMIDSYLGSFASFWGAVGLPRLGAGTLARKASVEQIAVVARRAADAGIAIQTLSAFAVRGTGRAGIVLGYGAIPTG